MLWKPINFQGIVVIDKELVGQLRSYLDEKSRLLAEKIVAAFCGQEAIESTTTPWVLQEAIRMVNTTVEAASSEDQGEGASINGPWRPVREAVDAASWEYIEVLEGCTVEFLQQLNNVRLDRLTLEVLQSIDSVRMLVMEHLDRAQESLASVNNALKQWRDATQPRQSAFHRLLRAAPWRKVVLDRSLFDHLQKTKEALDRRDHELKDAYQEYNRLSLKVQRSLHKLDEYQVLKTLEAPAGDKFGEIYRFLKMWKTNLKSRVLPDQDFVRIVRSITTPQDVITVCKEYYLALREGLFQISRALKSGAPRSNEEVAELRRKMRTKLTGLSAEIHSLGSSIGRFRDFLLRTDPNPYVRSRWGFSEWVVGPEPREAKELMHIGYEVEGLDTIFFQLTQSLERDGTVATTLRLMPAYGSIQSVLHEMGQPLASVGMMRTSADSLVDLLDELDELGSTQATVVTFMGEVLGKGLRADWKYHVLHELPQFHQLYRTHMGIVGPIDDPTHRSYFQKMRRLRDQVKEWTKAGDILAHAPEIEKELEEVKGYLQEFLSALHSIDEGQQLSRTQILSTTTKRRQALLEYRYLFGGICQLIVQNQQGGDQMRNQYLFIDQYFEFIENKLNELARR